MVADNDEDFLASKAANLKEVHEVQPQTNFGAMIAKQIKNDVQSQPSQRNFAGALIGEPTKNCVKWVSKKFAFFFCLNKYSFNQQSGI